MSTLKLVVCAVVALVVASAAAVGTNSTNIFHPWTEPTSIQTSMKALSLAYGAYCTPDHIKTWDCDLCKQEFPGGLRNVTILSDPKHDTQGFVALTDDPRTGIVVAFRGTQLSSLKNWISDLSFNKAKSPYMGCMVHTGFLTAYQGVAVQLHNAVLALRAEHPGTVVTVAGHSLGGALANMAAAGLVGLMGDHEDKEDIFHTVRLSTFGAPRVGDDCFAKMMNNTVPNHQRMTKANDPVPRVPTVWMGFRHNPLEILETTKHNVEHYHECDGSGEDEKCSNDFTPYNVMAHLNYMGIYEDCTISHFAPSLGHSPESLKKYMRTFSAFHESSFGDDEEEE